MKEWISEPLSKICFMTSGGTPSRRNLEFYKDGTIPWVKSGELENNVITETDEYITEAGLDNSSAKIFPKGTLLIALYGATIGKLAFLGIDAATNQAVCGIFKNDKVDLKYLYYFLLFSRPNLVKQGQGGAQPNISQTILKKLIVPYPMDKGEQQRIVARIEELFSQLDDAEATLQKTKAQLALYNQAVLHSIFNTANGSKEYAIEEICESIVDCPHSTPKWISHGKLCLRTTNFRRGYLDLSEPNYVSEETFERRNARLVPMPGDILYSREGAILGIACIIPEDTYVCLGQRMMLLRTNRKVLNKYLMYYLNSPAVTTLIGNKTGGSASPHINVGDIKKIRIPIPEFEQQEKLVAQIESRLSLCKEIEQTISILLLKLTSCKQSVLNTEIKGDDKNEQRNYRL